MKARTLFAPSLLLALLILWSPAAGTPRIAFAQGNTIRVNTVAGFRSAVGTLQAGDTLIVEEGEYVMSYLDIRDLDGTASEWITIQAEGHVVIRATSYGANAVEIRETHYLRFVGFEIWSETDPYAGIDGIKISGSHSSNIVFDQLYIHDVSGNGISVFATSAHHLTLTNSEIAYCTGSGLYWGYPGSDIVHDVVIQHNYIHHCPRDPSQETHYGIQFKGWSYRALIADNVLHDVGGTSRCGIVVYYGRRPLQGDDPADVNVVRGNVLWNCRNEGITAMSDAVIENNIVFDAGYGINLQTYSDESFSGSNYVENLTVRNNTVFRCQSSCIYISGWGSLGTGVSFTGNAAYQDGAGATAIGGSTGAATVSGNVYYGTCSLSGGAVPGAGLSDFVGVTPAAVVPQLDFYPAAGSVLLDRLPGSGYASLDFNGTPRPHNGAGDAGAYERVGSSNPGWHIVEGPKSTGSELVLHGTPADQAIRLTWTVTGSLPATGTWRIDYAGPPGAEPSPITGLVSTTRAYPLAGLTNYTRYTVTLSTEPSLLSDTVYAMPTDRFVYLPLVLK